SFLCYRTTCDAPPCEIYYPCCTYGCCTMTSQGLCLGGGGAVSGGAASTCSPTPCTPPLNDDCRADNPALIVGTNTIGNCLATDSVVISPASTCGTGPDSGGHHDVFFRFT